MILLDLGRRRNRARSTCLVHDMFLDVAALAGFSWALACPLCAFAPGLSCPAANRLEWTQGLHLPYPDTEMAGTHPEGPDANLHRKELGSSPMDRSITSFKGSRTHT